MTNVLATTFICACFSLGVLMFAAMLGYGWQVFLFYMLSTVILVAYLIVETEYGG